MFPLSNEAFLYSLHTRINGGPALHMANILICPPHPPRGDPGRGLSVPQPLFQNPLSGHQLSWAVPAWSPTCS